MIVFNHRTLNACVLDCGSPLPLSHRLRFSGPLAIARHQPGDFTLFRPATAPAPERGFGQEKFPNEPILKIIKSLSINNKCKKTISRLAKSKPNLPSEWLKETDFLQAASPVRAYSVDGSNVSFQSHSKDFKAIQRISKAFKAFQRI